MPDSISPQSFSDLPPQTAANPTSLAQTRARYFNTGNAFDVTLPPVPNAVFVDQANRALDPASPTGLIACDVSDAMACGLPATTPLVLARYARIRAGETLVTDFVCSGVLYYAISSAGTTRSGPETVTWSAGDVFVVPGNMTQTHRVGDTDAVLWLVTNEPQLAFENFRAPAEGHALTEVVHYPADEIERQIALIHRFGSDSDVAGSALIFSSDMQEASRNVLPTLTLAMNTLPPGVTQRPHRHNSVAVLLVIQGENCFSRIDSERKDWAPWATTITPPMSVHSHHNEGDKRAMFLIVQDGGLFYHARTMGFEFVEN